MNTTEDETRERDYEQPSYYSIIPAKVRYDKELDLGAILMYGEITSLSNAQGYCFAGNKYFARLYGVSTSTISRWVKELVDRGYVTLELVYIPGTKEIDYRKITIRDMEGMPTLVQSNIESKSQTKRFTL